MENALKIIPGGNGLISKAWKISQNYGTYYKSSDGINMTGRKNFKDFAQMGFGTSTLI